MAAPPLPRRSFPPFATDLSPNVPPSINEAEAIGNASTPARQVPAGKQYRTPRGLKIIDPETQYLVPGSRIRTTGAPRFPSAAANSTGNSCPVSSPTVGEGPAGADIGTGTGPIQANIGTPAARARPTIPTEGAIYTTLVGSQEIETIILSTDPATGQPLVTLAISRTGARNLYGFTRESVGEPITLVLDGQVLVSPTLNAPVSTKAVIRGLDDESYALLLSQLVPLCP